MLIFMLLLANEFDIMNNIEFYCVPFHSERFKHTNFPILNSFSGFFIQTIET